MGQEILFKNALLVTPEDTFCGTLLVKDGLIVRIDRGSFINKGIDLEKDYLTPGLIELHTDQLERHISPRPGVCWPSIAAVLAHDAALVASGITTVLDALALGDTIGTNTRIRDLGYMTIAIETAQKKSLLRADHLLHLRCELSYAHVVELLESLVNNPLVKLVSLMDHTPGQRQFTSIKKFCHYYQGMYGFSDEQMQKIIKERQENHHLFASRNRKEILKICKDLNLPVASHDDTTVEHVREAASEGIVFCEFPTTLEAAQAARAYGLSILMGAPNLVLGKSHSGNVSALELAKENLLDLLSSDYIPASLIQGAFLLYHELGFSLPQALSTITSYPARILNLHDRGVLQEGKKADLVRIKWIPPLPVVRNVWKGGERIF